MTIKRKLLLSNIMIIALPTVTVLVCGIILFFLIFGTDIKDDYMSRSSRVDYMTDTDAPDFLEDGDYKQIEEKATIYRNAGGDYAFVFQNKENVPIYHQAHSANRHIFLWGIVFTTLFIFLINRLIARHILKSIITPLDTLTDGVNEIRNGNLDYRIDYKKKDEFAPVCNAFNDMANRLLDMTTQREREEKSRKELIAGISHDLRTPLTSIKAYVVGLETGVASSSAMQKKYLNTINQKATDLEYIINQLFLFSKLDVGDFPFQMEPINVYGILEQLVEDMEEEYKNRGVVLKYLSSPGEAICKVDMVQFCNVIQNIWSNSAKYKDKEVVVSTMSCEIEEENLILSISDDGPGVPTEALDKLFEVFYRTDSSRQNVSLGSGLGLAISSKIISSFGGNITASNIPDGGLCLRISLPLADESETEVHS